MPRIRGMPEDFWNNSDWNRLCERGRSLDEKGRWKKARRETIKRVKKSTGASCVWWRLCRPVYDLERNVVWNTHHNYLVRGSLKYFPSASGKINWNWLTTVWKTSRWSWQVCEHREAPRISALAWRYRSTLGKNCGELKRLVQHVGGERRYNCAQCGCHPKRYKSTEV
jgi:hypothetical protein